MKLLPSGFVRLALRAHRCSRKRPVILYGGLTLAVVAIWCWIYGRVPGTDGNRVPVEYHWDALFLMAVLKVFSAFPAPWDLHVNQLGAPFVANWNDYPFSEKLIFYLGGALTRFFDPGAAVNLLLLLGFVFNAFGFCWTARRLGARPLQAAAGAIVFSFSTYMLLRGTAHIVLLYAGHVPLLFYLCRRLQRGCLNRRALWAWGSLYVVVAAFLSPYYFIFGMMMLAFVSIRLAINGRLKDASVPASLMGVGALAFVANQANVFLYRWQHGENPALHTRGVQEQLQFGLRLPDLFMPLENPLKAWGSYARDHYQVTGLTLENAAAFLGLVGCVGLVAMVSVSIGRGMRRQAERIPAEAWFAFVAYMFGSIGGAAMLLGVLGFSWLRATARYSIIILCAVLLWGSRTCKFCRWSPLGSVLWIALAAYTVYESNYGWLTSQRTAVPAQVKSDRDFARELESHLPQGAAVFQLPVMPFPEVPSINAMADYEPFRPYIWSKMLRFSYGSQKGRPRENWQATCARKPVPDMIRELSDKGFDALLIHRAGFADRGRGLEVSLAGAGMSRIAGNPEGDMVAYRVK